MKLGVTLDILNQKDTPAFYADTLANRPAAGFTGRVFISTDTLDLYRDTGTTWVLLSPSSTGTITGSGAAGQVTFFSAASSITGSNNLFWDNTNGHLGIKTITPDCALDVNHDGAFVAKFNNTTSANTLLGIYNADNPQWLIGSNNVADDLIFYDATNSPTLVPTTTMKIDGTTFIGGQNTGSGKLNVYSATSDNGIQISGANAPSLRIDNAPSGATKRIGLGISTAVNNFIQGSTDRDMCIFNGSTTASPMLFGIYGTTNVQEAARISAARNFLIGTSVDGGQLLQVNGGARASGYYLTGMTAGSGALYWTSDRVTLANYNSGGSVLLEVNGGLNGLLIGSDLSATFYSKVIGVTSGLNSGFNTGSFIAKSSGNDFRYTQIGYDNTGNYGWIQSLEQGTSYTNLVLNAAGGAVAINTTNPNTNSQLSLSNSTSTSLYLAATNTNVDTRDFCIITNNTNFGDLTIKQGNSQGADATTGTNRFYVSPTGNILIGGSTNSGQKLQVFGTAKIDGLITQGGGIYAASNQFSLGGATTGTFYTFANISANQVYLVSVRQAGSGANNVIGIVFIYGTNMSAYNIGQDNTNPALFLTLSASGLNLQLTTGAGYGTTTWDYTITQIK